MKIGATFKSSIELGYIIEGAFLYFIEIIVKFSTNLDLSFQIVDDILDVTDKTYTLGKTVEKDRISIKSTYVCLFILKKIKNYFAKIRRKKLLSCRENADCLLKD